MKLILAIIRDDAVDSVSHALVDRKYTVTQISTVGGFLRRGSTTLVVGVENDQVDEAMGVIRSACENLPHTEGHNPATVFVLNAADFIQV
ncbi:MAG TPA: cyclic-di-AMP receptor [Aggregatilineales bacterium]|nr:cyclic-di-AMP receptor [Aggregatilineales bacterium]